MTFDRDFQHLLSMSGASKGLSSSLIPAILERIGESTVPTQQLGHGKFAVAFWLKQKRKRVLKITRDVEDAYAMQRVKDRPQKHLVKVYDVFEIVEHRLWGIVAEKLTPMDYEEKDAWQELWNILSSEEYAYLGDELVQNGLTPGFADEVVDAIENPIDDGEEDEEDEDVWDRHFYEVPEDDILDALRNWGKELSALNIKFYDFHPGNIMMRRHDYILVDLGYGAVPHTKVPELDIGQEGYQYPLKFSQAAATRIPKLQE